MSVVLMVRSLSVGEDARPRGSQGTHIVYGMYVVFMSVQRHLSPRYIVPALSLLIYETLSWHCITCCIIARLRSKYVCVLLSYDMPAAVPFTDTFAGQRSGLTSRPLQCKKL